MGPKRGTTFWNISLWLFWFPILVLLRMAQKLFTLIRFLWDHGPVPIYGAFLDLGGHLTFALLLDCIGWLSYIILPPLLWTYLLLSAPFRALSWWVFFFTKLLRKSTRTTYRDSPNITSRAIRRRFAARGKTFLPCHAARKLIFTACQVRGAWACLLVRKHVASIDIDVEETLTDSTSEVHNRFSPPYEYVARRIKKPPDGLISDILFFMIVLTIFLLVFLQRFLRLYGLRFGLINPPISECIQKT